MSSVSGSDGGYSYYQRSIGDLEEEIRSDAKRREEKRQEALETQAKRHEETLRRNEEKQAEVLSKVKEDASESVSKARADARREVEDSRSQVYDRLGKMNAETQLQREESRQAVEHAREDYEKQSTRVQSAQSGKTDQILAAQVEREEESARQLRDSHERETSSLRKQVQDLTEVDRKHAKGFAEGRATAISELENQWRLIDHVRNDGAEKEIAAVRDRSKAVERYYTQANDKNLKDQGMELTHMLNERTEQAHSEQQALEQQFQRHQNEMETRMKLDRELSQKTNERELMQAAENSERALNQQAHAFNSSYADMADANAAKISRLEGAIQEARTSEDVSKISPAAEEAVRNATSRDYEKTFVANDSRRDEENSALRRNFQDRYQELLADKREMETRLTQDRALSAHSEQSAYLDSLADVVDDRDRSLRHKEGDNERAMDTLTRDHARLLDGQRREYEDVIQNLKNDANTRLTGMRQETEFNSKMAQKAFSSRQNELIREYEKKLADQRADYDTQLGDLKSEMAVTLRESERRTQKSIEEVSKGYEQRIAQMEFQNKERERLISQNYQDELEKVKRSNALLIQKKS